LKEERMGRKQIPSVRVVGGLEEHPSAPVRWFLHKAGRTLRRPGVHESLAFAIGMWPLWVLGGAGMGLVWFLAMTQSP
jgi:hypothetical protein